MIINLAAKMAGSADDASRTFYGEMSKVLFILLSLLFLLYSQNVETLFAFWMFKYVDVFLWSVLNFLLVCSFFGYIPTKWCWFCIKNIPRRIYNDNLVPLLTDYVMILRLLKGFLTSHNLTHLKSFKFTNYTHYYSSLNLPSKPV